MRFLARLNLHIEPRKKWPDGLTFEGHGGSLAPELQAGEGRALCRWGDPGLGDLVREGKRCGHFDEHLVDCAAELIRSRWKPQPRPEWVTCVPSLRRPTLVPDFARRLAKRLRLPFIECARKAQETELQKTRQNSFQQVQNLEHAFIMDRNEVQPTPVLLVDDMVDSRWTVTILALKLIKAGSGPVFPFALADSSGEDGD